MATTQTENMEEKEVLVKTNELQGKQSNIVKNNLKEIVDSHNKINKYTWKQVFKDEKSGDIMCKEEKMIDMTQQHLQNASYKVSNKISELWNQLKFQLSLQEKLDEVANFKHIEIKEENQHFLQEVKEYIS